MTQTAGRHRAPGRYNPASELGRIVADAGPLLPRLHRLTRAWVAERARAAQRPVHREPWRVDAVAGTGDKTVATVTFEDSGAQKRLLLRYAPLTKVED